MLEDGVKYGEEDKQRQEESELHKAKPLPILRQALSERKWVPLSPVGLTNTSRHLACYRTPATSLPLLIQSTEGDAVAVYLTITFICKGTANCLRKFMKKTVFISKVGGGSKTNHKMNFSSIPIYMPWGTKQMQLLNFLSEGKNGFITNKRAPREYKPLVQGGEQPGQR